MAGWSTRRWLAIGVVAMGLVTACGDDSAGDGSGSGGFDDPGAEDPSEDAVPGQLRGYVELDEALTLIDEALVVYDTAAQERSRAGDGPAIVPEDEVAVVSGTRNGTANAEHILHSELDEVIERDGGEESAYRLLDEALGWLVEAHDVLSNAPNLPPEARTNLDAADTLIQEAELALGSG